MKELIGKKVVRLEINEDESVLKFIHPEGDETLYVAIGDCCSATWFADITGVDALLNHTIAAAENIEMKDVIQDQRCRQEVDEFYGVKLTTDAGIVNIVYRNSSNGYYGGWICFLNPEDKPKYKENNKFRPITEDWQA